MAKIGHPAYSSIKTVTQKELSRIEDKEFFDNYFAIKCSFSFPETVIYPCLPCSVDPNTTVYPLEGSGVITGLEYLAASKMGCVFEKVRAIKIPFSEREEVGTGKGMFHPFLHLIKDLQSNRREYPKGSFLNLMYKEIGNSIYGQIAKGIGRKSTFDIKTGGMVEVHGGELSNPILAGYITGFIRSVIGECLHNISVLKG
jgi:hypothetical protein